MLDGRKPSDEGSGKLRIVASAAFCLVCTCHLHRTLSAEVTVRSVIGASLAPLLRGMLELACTSLRSGPEDQQTVRLIPVCMQPLSAALPSVKAPAIMTIVVLYAGRPRRAWSCCMQMRPAEYWVKDGDLERIRRAETVEDHLHMF